MITTLDVTVPSQLTLALLPDLVLMGGAMILLIIAGWRRETQTHQRNVGIAGIILCGIVSLLVLTWATRYSGTPGPVAIDDFRWLMDIVILLGTVFADRALSMDDNMRSGITAAESHVLIPARVVGHDAARRGARSDDRLPRHRAHVDLGVRAGGHQPAARLAGALKYSLLGAFSRRSCSMASRWCYGHGSTNLP